MGERCNTEDYAGTFGVGVGCRLVQSGIDLDTLRVDSCFSVGNGRGIMVGVDGMRSFTLVGSTVGVVDEGSVRKAKSVGDGVGCRLVQSGMDSAAFGLSSFFSVGEVVDITVGVDGGRSIPLVGSRVDAIDGSGDGKLVGCVAGVR